MSAAQALWGGALACKLPASCCRDRPPQFDAGYCDSAALAAALARQPGGVRVTLASGLGGTLIDIYEDAEDAVRCASRVLEGVLRVCGQGWFHVVLSLQCGLDF